MPSLHPEERVGLLGKLRRERSEDQREHQRLDPDVLGDVEELLDKEVGAADDRRQPSDELDHNEMHLRVVAMGCAVEDERPDGVEFLDVTALAQSPSHVQRIRADEEDHERDLRPGG